ncbi:MAG: PKD domain-containing protein, partial [Planctomycetota bacterium]
ELVSGVPAPVAEFSGTPTSGVVPLGVSFTDLSSGGPVTSWSWDFGDTTSSTLQNPNHTYTSAGTYTVSLTATGPGGVDTETKVGYITVDEQPPVADFSGTPTSGTAPLLVTFTDLTSGGPVTGWSWDFGDTGTSTLQHPTHTYTTSGTYTVSLTVTGPGGNDTITKTDYITVTAPWQDLGNGLAGTHGLPVLTGEGSLAQGSTLALDMTNALENAPFVLVMGFSRADIPLKGGILVPATDWILFGLTTDSSGEFHFATSPNNPVTSGATLYLQYWVADPIGPLGYSATNGITQTAP